MVELPRSSAFVSLLVRSFDGRYRAATSGSCIDASVGIVRPRCTTKPVSVCEWLGGYLRTNIACVRRSVILWYLRWVSVCVFCVSVVVFGCTYDQNKAQKMAKVVMENTKQKTEKETIKNSKRKIDKAFWMGRIARMQQYTRLTVVNSTGLLFSRRSHSAYCWCRLRTIHCKLWEMNGKGTEMKIINRWTSLIYNNLHLQ